MSPRLRIRALRIRAETNDGPYGAELTFTSGLNVLEARNSMGKSICTQSVLYGLGMEAMLGSRHDVPLPDAMTEQLRTPSGAEIPVRESRIWLEIEGQDDRVVTLARWAKHETIDSRLVSVWEGPVLTEGGVFPQHDHLVRAEGVLDRDVGLHHFLADLVGWEVPEILLADGSAKPLYLEYLFPLIFVEQRGGWAGLQAIEPNFFLPEAKRRAVEFLLDLGVYERAKRKIELKQRQTALRQSWHEAIEAFKRQLQATGFVLSGVPSEPVQTWPPESEPGLVDVNSERTLEQEMSTAQEQLDSTISQLEALPEGAPQEVVEELEALQQELPILAMATSNLESEVAEETATGEALDRTLANLDRDMQRNKDAHRLRELGSEAWAAEEQECPTCHQALNDVVLEASPDPVMSLEDNIAYIEAEFNTFRLLREESGQHVTVREERLQSHQARLRDVRDRIRELRTEATASAQAPSAAVIGQRLQLESRLQRLKELEIGLQTFLDLLEGFSSTAAQIATEASSLPEEELTESERSKISELEDRVVDQLNAYGFESIPTSEITISDRSYHPARDGADISLGISASDGIRMVWAYLLGLMEVSRDQSTHHPGCLILDEPRQQSADRPSLNAFLSRASASGDHDEQVILATSEEPEQLAEGLEGIPHEYHQVSGRLLQPVT